MFLKLSAKLYTSVFHHGLNVGGPREAWAVPAWQQERRAVPSGAGRRSLPPSLPTRWAAEEQPWPRPGAAAERRACGGREGRASLAGRTLRLPLPHSRVASGVAGQQALRSPRPASLSSERLLCLDVDFPWWDSKYNIPENACGPALWSPWVVVLAPRGRAGSPGGSRWPPLSPGPSSAQRCSGGQRGPQSLAQGPLVASSWDSACWEPAFPLSVSVNLDGLLTLASMLWVFLIKFFFLKGKQPHSRLPVSARGTPPPGRAGQRCWRALRTSSGPVQTAGLRQASRAPRAAPSACRWTWCPGVPATPSAPTWPAAWLPRALGWSWVDSNQATPHTGGLGERQWPWSRASPGPMLEQ